MKTRTIYRDKAVSPDTEEYLSVTVTSDVELDTQPVKFTFDRVTYYDATWTGDPGLVRSARLLMNESNLPSSPASTIFVRVTDTPEAPIVAAGTLRVV